MQYLVFNPRPAQIDAILDAFTAPDQSLRQIAEACSTTVPALTAWAARPEIAERIAALDNFAANRARTAATFQLHRAVTVLTRTLDDFEAENKQRQAAARAPAPPPPGRASGGVSSSPSRHPALYDPKRRHPLAEVRDPPEPREPAVRIPHILDPEYIRRSRDSARRAAALLYHIARFTPPRPGEHRPSPEGRTSGPTGEDRAPHADSPEVPGRAAPPLHDPISRNDSHIPPFPTDPRPAQSDAMPNPVEPAQDRTTGSAEPAEDRMPAPSPDSSSDPRILDLHTPGPSRGIDFPTRWQRPPPRGPRGQFLPKSDPH